MDAADRRRALATVLRATAAAGRAALRHHVIGRGAVEVEWKADRTPVTIADHETNAVILEELGAAWPGVPVLSEESPAPAAGGDTRWIVDPIDGTRGFARGGLFWGPLIALEHRGRVEVGAMALPALGRTYWAARGEGAFRDLGRGPEPIVLSPPAAWCDAILSMGVERPLYEPPWRDGALALAVSAAATRSHGDLGGSAHVLDGGADAWIEAGLSPWDVAPLAVIAEEAGGVFSDFGGAPSIESGTAIVTSRALHPHVLRALAEAR